jgi:integrase
VARRGTRRQGSRLRPEISKNKDARVLPLSDELLEIIERAKAQRRLDCSYVFHLDGRQLRDFKRSWASAWKRAGVGKVLVHDLRRTAVRNMVRAGIPDRIAMALSAHKRRVTFLIAITLLARLIWRLPPSGYKPIFTTTSQVQR